MDQSSQEKKKLLPRIPAIYLLIAVLFGILSVNLINLQIVKGNENLFLSTSIKTSEVLIRAPRGLIYDRHGNELVVNQPAFQLIVELSELPVDSEEEVINTLASILDVEEKKLWKDFKAKAYNEDDVRVGLSHITLYQDIGRDKMVSIYSRGDDLPGIHIEVGTTREYVNGEDFAHVVGYIREVSADDIANGDYFAGDVIGATGLEQYYDSYLRGVNGRRVLETDRDNETVRELVPVEADPGNNVQLTIDADMQSQLTKALADGIERHQAGGGAAIIMDIHSGELLSLVSLPTFDPNKIVKGLTYNEYVSLSTDPTLPLYNRTISLTQPPGSTFKTIVASAALEEGVISPSTQFVSEGCMDLGGGFEFCEVGKRPLGPIDLPNAIARSSNIYFCKSMLQLGIDTLNTYTDQFGLGSKTGVDLYGEQGGTVASKDLKLKLEGISWYQGDSCNAGIGQGLTSVSPIQMVSWVSAIANGGVLYQPHLGKSILDGEGRIIEEFPAEERGTLEIAPENLETVRAGMYLVVNDPWGSAFPLRGIESDPAVKTGSAEAFRKVDGKFVGTAHSWVTGFFPYNEPKYAFVVYMEYGGWGFKSAEVMRDFLTWYDSTN